MQLDEFERISKFFKPLAAGNKGSLGLIDDAAVLPVQNLDGLIISTDSLVQGVHFRFEDPPYLIGQKALRTNLSDMAAMGGKPWVYTLSLVLGSTSPVSKDEWLAGLVEGLKSDQKTYSLDLIGGDSVSTSGPTVISVTILGKELPSGALRRSGALLEDDIYVTGTIGDSTLGLALLTNTTNILPDSESNFLMDRYQLPQPRINLGMALSACATAAIDISDGLVQDLSHICNASGLGARMDWPKIPLSNAAKIMLERGYTSIEEILSGGDDYELLFTAPFSARSEIEMLAKHFGTSISRIGFMEKGNKVTVRDQRLNVISLKRHGYRHV